MPKIDMHMYEKLIREDRTGFENMAEVHNALSEDPSFNRVNRLAANIEGRRPLHDAHFGQDRGRYHRRGAHQGGVLICGETLHQYLMYTAEEYRRPTTRSTTPTPRSNSAPTRGPVTGDRSWRHQTVATDEICCPLRIKLRGRRTDGNQ
jgi:dihydropyrimidinase